MKITKIDTDYFSRTDLSSYTDIIIPGTSGRGLSKDDAAKLKEWVSQGGTLIAYRNALNWVNNNELVKLKFRKDSLKAKNISFEQKRDYLGAQVTGGAIFEARQDRSHPINYGYKNTSQLP